MNDRLFIVIFFAILGFFLAFIISIIAGTSFAGIILRSILSAFLLGILGFILYFLLEKYSGLALEKDSNIKKDQEIKHENRAKEYSYSNESESKDDSNDNLNSSTTILDNSDEPISYEELFTKLNKDENEGKSKDEKIYENKTDDDFQRDSINKESIIDEIKKEKDRENVEIQFSENLQIVEGDSELNPKSISAEEAAKISATSKMSTIAGEVKSIDDKYIYFTKGTKIENKPEKIAKVIKEMLKNE